MPHSEIPGSQLGTSSSGLIAGSHVLHRLLTPRHPPHALISLITPTSGRCHHPDHDLDQETRTIPTNRDTQVRHLKPNYLGCSTRCYSTYASAYVRQHSLSTYQRSTRPCVAGPVLGAVHLMCCRGAAQSTRHGLDYFGPLVLAATKKGRGQRRDLGVVVTVSAAS